MIERDSLNGVLSGLRVSRRRRRAIARELRSHVEETRAELLREGWSPEQAERESLVRLGDLREIAGAFDDVYRPRRTRMALGLGLAGALLLGVYGGGNLASATAAHRSVPPAVTSSSSHHLTHVRSK